MRTFLALATATAICLTPAAVSAAPAELAPLRGSSETSEYIVVLKDGMPATRIDAVADRAGAKVGHRFTVALTGFSTTLNQAQLNAVRHNPAVAYVAPDQVIQLPPSPTRSKAGAPTTAIAPAGTQTSGVQDPAPSWGLERIDERTSNFDNAYHWLSTGLGVQAYVIDTGVRANHPDFGGRVVGGYDATGGGNPDDCNGHGTAVAGIVGSTTYGVAKEVTIVPVRVFGCDGSAATSDVLLGIQWVTANAVYPATVITAWATSTHPIIHDAVENSIVAGDLSYSVPSGPDTTCNHTPASVPEALTVAPLNPDSTGSAQGFCVDLFAPGASIRTTWYAGGAFTFNDPAAGAPHAGGVAALYLEFHPTATSQQVHDAIVSNATRCGWIGFCPPPPGLILYSLLT